MPRRRIKGTAWWNDYAEHLASEEWASIRKQALARDGHLCQHCRMRKATVVHHLTYGHVGDEQLDELLSLCTECHRAIHRKKPKQELEEMP
jgi:5-methylcytosine-specific restriction endonuclease McrA